MKIIIELDTMTSIRTISPPRELKGKSLLMLPQDSQLIQEDIDIKIDFVYLPEVRHPFILRLPK